jgi:ribosomal protein S18 acetylase RimI-like enzyme
MKVTIRRTQNKDIEKIYNLQCNCFTKTDAWYKNTISNYLRDGLVVETEHKDIIGVLLQGKMTPCEKKFSFMDNSKEDVFEPVTENGKTFLKNNMHFEEIQGIVLICVDNKYRGKGLAKKLIEKHFNDNKNKIICLNTRRTNVNAFNLYKNMGYEHIAYIKNKYFLPDEDSIFMIKDLTNNAE